MKVRLGEIVKLAFDDVKIQDDDIVYVDKKISECLNAGDLIHISSSDVVLRVTRKSKYCEQAAPVVAGNVLGGDNLDDKKNRRDSFYENISRYSEKEPRKLSHDIDSIQSTDEELLFDARNFDSYFDDKIINRQLNTKKAFTEIMKKRDYQKLLNKPEKHDNFKLSGGGKDSPLTISFSSKQPM
jgi:hypothetical protein